MTINKNDLYRQISFLVDSGQNVYVGKINEIYKDEFDISNLYVANLFNFSVYLPTYETKWNETAFKYIFEKIQIEEHFFFREIFSGAIFEWFDFNSLLKMKGMYLTEPMTYEEFVNSVTNRYDANKIRVKNQEKRSM